MCDCEPRTIISLARGAPGECDWYRRPPPLPLSSQAIRLRAPAQDGVWLQAHLLEMGNAWLRPVARLSKAVADCYTLAEVYIEHATRALEDIAAHPGRQAGLMGRQEFDIGALLLKVRSWVESLRR